MLIDLNNWKKIPTETYKHILEEAKVRYDELLSQSENITGKIIQTILVNGVVAAWFTNFLSKNKFCLRSLAIILFVGFTLFIYWWLVSILYPRKTVLRGTSPTVALGDEIDLSGDEKGENYTEEEKVKVYFYHQVNRYRKRIEGLRPNYNERAKKYKKGLVFSLLLFAYIVVVVLMSSF